jgi:RNA polymerase sigma-70 factor (ECF subfamily)
VYNLCLNRLPRLRRELLQAEPLEEAVVDLAPAPPDVFEVQERLAFLHDELNQLPAKYRLVLTLRYLQDLSYAEIAAALDVPMGTVKTHLHRARRLLTERLRRWEERSTGAEHGVEVRTEHAMPCLQYSGE